MEKKLSKIDTIGDAYIMVAWLNEGLDPYVPKVKHAPKVYPLRAYLHTFSKSHTRSCVCVCVCVRVCVRVCLV